MRLGEDTECCAQWSLSSLVLLPSWAHVNFSGCLYSWTELCVKLSEKSGNWAAWVLYRFPLSNYWQSDGKSFSWKKVISLITILQVSNLISLNLTRSPPILSGLRLSIMNSFNIFPISTSYVLPSSQVFLAIFKIILIFQGPTWVISLISVLLSYLISFMLFYKLFYILLEQERIQSTNQLPWCLSFSNFVFSSFYLFDSLLYHSFTKVLNPLRAGKCFSTSVLAVTVHCKW